ncbi:MAG: hypothetical protein AMJ72_02515 [Acidithiobacillales bacterium SM1_46]|jgi:hypothetical protein|nr:MAG: hypothetical protein AMJ72_02515 [Acidithiobacillales bacterium SM1_46]
MNPVYVDKIGILAPGLTGWEQARATLAGHRTYQSAPLPPLKPAALAPDVRRRTSDHIRFAVEVATDTSRGLSDVTRRLATVFASCDADGQITHDILTEVAKDTPQVSPTRFHNSVNNAAAGYWCMAVGSQQPSTSVAAWDDVAAAGLLEAVAQVLLEHTRVLLVIHDLPMPEPLNSARPVHAAFGAGMLLSRARSAESICALALELAPSGESESTLTDSGLETLRRDNPAARSLALICAIARNQATTVVMPFLGHQVLRIGVQPCA